MYYVIIIVGIKYSIVRKWAYRLKIFTKDIGHIPFGQEFIPRKIPLGKTLVWLIAGLYTEQFCNKITTINII